MCSSGAADLNVTDFITPIKCQNVSKMISNCLAINGRFLEEETKSRTTGTEEYQNGFPTWLSTGDRKLLQSARVRAHLVVAKDGSGKFRTVQAAINAAARRRGRSRFVIYIKRGVYKENIEVGNDNANIMLVGDGIRFTVITSGRSVAAGFTTFNSATAGMRLNMTYMVNYKLVLNIFDIRYPRSRVHGSRHKVCEHSRTKNGASSGTTVIIGPIGVPSVQLRGLPRHTHGAVTETILQAMLRIRYNRLHFWERGSGSTKLLDLRAKAFKGASERDHRAGPRGPISEQRNLDPQLANTGGG